MSTREKARAAFIELTRQRIRPTVAKIREQIGGGGTDLIRSVMQEMEEDLYAKMFSAYNRPDVPASLTDKIAGIWNECNAEAEKRFEADRNALENLHQEAMASKEEAEHRCTALSAQNGELQKDLATKAGEIGALRETLQATEDQLVNLQGEVRQQRSEMDRVRQDADARIKIADNRAAKAEEEYDGLRKQLLVAHDREKSALQAQVRDLDARLKAAVQDLADERQKAHDLEEQLRRVSAELGETRGRLKAVEEDRDGLRRQVASRGRARGKPWPKRP